MSASPLKSLLKEQAKELDAIGQHVVQPKDFLTSVSPLLNDGSPARSRGASASSTRRTLPSAVSPVKTSADAAVSAQSPTKTAENVSPARGPDAVPAAPDAYMNELPLSPYGSTAHLSLHVSDTLHLALRVLCKSQQVGRVLTEEERSLVAQIAAFAAPVGSAEEGTAVAEVPEEVTTGVQEFGISAL